MRLPGFLGWTLLDPTLVAPFSFIRISDVFRLEPTQSLPENLSQNDNKHAIAEIVSKNRREALCFIASSAAGFPLLCNAAGPNEQILRLETPEDKAGIALYDVTIGSPPRKVAAIRRIVSNNRPNLQPGLILKEYPNSSAVVERIRSGPYPIELKFYNLDCSNGELGEALTAQDALMLSQQQSQEASAITDSNDRSYVKRVVREPPLNCRVKSRRDDVLEINYDAHIGSMDGILYDSSTTRGTGRPYQMVMGSGDMVPGVDQGLYDMCPGEIRQIDMPPYLAYGAKGNKLFRIPPNARLVWEVELVAINSMRQQDESNNDE